MGSPAPVKQVLLYKLLVFPCNILQESKRHIGIHRRLMFIQIPYPYSFLQHLSFSPWFLLICGFSIENALSDLWEIPCFVNWYEKHRFPYGIRLAQTPEDTSGDNSRKNCPHIVIRNVSKEYMLYTDYNRAISLETRNSYFFVHIDGETIPIRYISPQSPSHTSAFRSKIPESCERHSPRLF